MSSPRAWNTYHRAACALMGNDLVRVVSLSAALEALLVTIEEVYGSDLSERMEEQVSVALELLKSDGRYVRLPSGTDSSEQESGSS